MMGVNPTAPRFLAGAKIDGLTQWSPCNYCLWQNGSADEWEQHMNTYHFPFAGNFRDQPVKWLWKVREIKDAQNPLDSYFIVESVEKPTSAKTSAKKDAPKPLAKSKPVRAQTSAKPEPLEVIRVPTCAKCGVKHYTWETHSKAYYTKRKQEREDKVLEVHAPQDRIIRGTK